MKLITLECPKCGAQLDVNYALSYIECKYCGHRFGLYDEAKPSIIEIVNPRKPEEDSQKPEDTRLKPEDDAKQCYRLAKQVKDLIPPICILNDLASELKKLCEERKCLKEKEKAVCDPRTKMKLLIIPLCIAFLVVLLSLYQNMHLWILVGGVLLSIFSFFLGNIIRNIKRIKIRKQIDEKNVQCIRIQNEIQNIKQENLIYMIPKRYRSAEKLEAIYNILNDHRAGTIRQAINVYEDDQYKNRMENYKKEEIILQREQLQELKYIRIYQEELPERKM